MSITSDKGKKWEQLVAKITRRKLKVAARRNSGSHASWWRNSDVWIDGLPLHLECKDQKTLKPKEWYAQAKAAAGTKTPVVVFNMDESPMVVLEYERLLDLLVEISDLQSEVAYLRRPVATKTSGATTGHVNTWVQVEEKKEMVETRRSHTCREGHIADEYGYCQWKGCRFSRTYTPPKTKKDKAD